MIMVKLSEEDIIRIDEINDKLPHNLHTRSGIAYIKGLYCLSEGNLDQAKIELQNSKEEFGKWSPYRYWVRGTLNRLDCVK
jgi:hypothetical protein